MKLILEFVLIFSTFLALHRASGQSCNCSNEYQPFCGTDEVTYPNRCALNCARSSVRNLQVKFEGVCAVRYNENDRRGGAGRDPKLASGSENQNKYVRPPPGFPQQPNKPDPIVCTETRNGKAFRVKCENRKYV